MINNRANDNFERVIARRKNRRKLSTFVSLLIRVDSKIESRAESEITAATNRGN